MTCQSLSFSLLFYCAKQFKNSKQHKVQHGRNSVLFFFIYMQFKNNYLFWRLNLCMQGAIMEHQDQLEETIVQSMNLTILVTQVFLLSFF